MLKIKRLLIPLVSIITTFSIASCNVPAAEITFSNLESSPETYADKVITIDGYWFDGFEMAVLAERLEADDYAPSNLKPRGVLIWVSGGLSEEVRENLYLQPENVTGYPAHYGKVRLEGKLKCGGNYGHLNSYQFQLEVINSKMLPWSPGQE